MPRRSTTPPPKQPANLTAEQKLGAVLLLQKRIGDLRTFDVNLINAINDPQISVMSDKIETALVQIFGAETLDYERYMYAAHLRSGGMYLAGHGPSLRTVQQEVEQGRQRAIATLEGIVGRFQEELELTSPEPQPGPQPTRPPMQSRKVFVVHGRDDGPREAVARFLQQIDFEPIIMHEQANRSRTVIEKIKLMAMSVSRWCC